MVASSTHGAWLMLGGGIALLGLGASWLVDGASRLALRLGVTPMLVGLTVVGFGTSMPELSVSVLAATRGSGGLSLGNAVGSNVMNLLLVLGLSALLRPMQVTGGRRLLLRDLGFGLLPAVVLLAAGWRGELTRGAAFVLLALFALFMTVCVAQARARGRSDAPTAVEGTAWRHLAVVAIGIAVLVGGAELMVRGGVALAHRFGVSEAVIGLTLVAFGTSLPELATSVAAAIKREADISVGNVLGSNVFNLGLVVGLAFAIRPGGVPAFVILQDVPFLVVATLFVGLVVLRDRRVGRGEGAAMLALFAAYLVFLVVRGG